MAQNPACGQEAPRSPVIRLTHEYVIATGGVILTPGATTTEPVSTAIAWAADHVLAVGVDEVVSAISRGDSTFIDLGGCAVSQAPGDPDLALATLRSAVAAGRPFRTPQVLADAGLIDPATGLEPGSPAELAFWSADPASIASDAAASLRLVAIVRAGAFTEVDEHVGPFPRSSRP